MWRQAGVAFQVREPNFMIEKDRRTQGLAWMSSRRVNVNISTKQWYQSCRSDRARWPRVSSCVRGFLRLSPVMGRIAYSKDFIKSLRWLSSCLNAISKLSLLRFSEKRFMLSVGCQQHKVGSALTMSDICMIVVCQCWHCVRCILSWVEPARSLVSNKSKCHCCHASRIYAFLVLTCTLF